MNFTVYSKHGCPYCTKVLQVLSALSTSKGFAVREYSLGTDFTKEEFYKMIENWLYYASKSPVWNKRILRYNGTINHDTKTVTFKNEDDCENFRHYRAHPFFQVREASLNDPTEGGQELFRQLPTRPLRSRRQVPTCCSPYRIISRAEAIFLR